jgi:hypothetical protein
MARKARGYVPPKRSKGPPPATREPVDRASLATIDTTAGLGRSGITVGARVRILGTGLFAGETAVVEKLVGGVIPSALVRTDAGRTRQVRTIDLEPIGDPGR